MICSVEDMFRRILPHTMSQLGNEQQLLSEQQEKSRQVLRTFLMSIYSLRCTRRRLWMRHNKSWLLTELKLAVPIEPD